MIYFREWRCRQVGCFVLGLVVGLAWVFPAQAQTAANKCYKRNYTFNFLAENDLWGSGSDQHFTHGTRLSFVESRKEVDDIQSCTPDEMGSGGLDFVRAIFGPAWEDASTKSSQVSFILGQNIFTPEDITNPNLVANDRPYAGWLYVGIGLIKRQKSGSIWVFDTLELNLGIVGPQAYAQDVQT